MPNITMDLQGAESIRNRFSRSPVAIADASEEMLQAATLIAEGTAKENAPIDRGILRGSIHSKVDKIGGETIGVVGTNLDYAPYQEYGTGIYGPAGTPIYPKQAKALRFIGKGGNIVFAGSVNGVGAKKFMAKGMQAVRSNLSKIRSIGLAAAKKKLGF